MFKHKSTPDGSVQSLRFTRNGMDASVGVVGPGEHHFTITIPERMTVVSGELRVRFAQGEWRTYPVGTYFEVPGKSSFDLEASGGPAAYLCEFLPAS